jgi:hypothetical protein
MFWQLGFQGLSAVMVCGPLEPLSSKLMLNACQHILTLSTRATQVACIVSKYPHEYEGNMAVQRQRSRHVPAPRTNWSETQCARLVRRHAGKQVHPLLRDSDLVPARPHKFLSERARDTQLYACSRTLTWKTGPAL